MGDFGVKIRTCKHKYPYLREIRLKHKYLSWATCHTTLATDTETGRV